MYEGLKYVIMVSVVLVIDIIWLTANKKTYSTLYGKDIRLANIRLVPAVVTYVCVISGIVFFSIPMIKKEINRDTDILGLFLKCLLWGGGLGFITYGVFNFTNMSVLSSYNIKTGIIDTLWGTTIYTIACFLFFMIR
jgi:uncharacterized membrane protein